LDDNRITYFIKMSYVENAAELGLAVLSYVLALWSRLGGVFGDY
jgi:hypothetical protein